MSQERQIEFARKLERQWFCLVADGDDVTAKLLGPVVDAIFENRPIEAVSRCRQKGLPKSLVQEIQENFRK